VRAEQKVFCTGFYKTGTTSFGSAMKLLGYHHTSFRKDLLDSYSKNNYENLYQFVNKFDSFDDVPFNDKTVIQLLDKKYPNCKFVHLHRDPKEWKNSFIQWTGKITNNQIDVEDWFTKFKDHQSFIDSYFKIADPNKFIALDISDEEGFKKLADFLNKDHKGRFKFPHENETKNIRV